MIVSPERSENKVGTIFVALVVGENVVEVRIVDVLVL